MSFVADDPAHESFYIDPLVRPFSWGNLDKYVWGSWSQYVWSFIIDVGFSDDSILLDQFAKDQNPSAAKFSIDVSHLDGFQAD